MLSKLTKDGVWDWRRLRCSRGSTCVTRC